MSLISSKLTNVVPHPDGGGCIARCPACAAQGSDKTGNHLRVFADGRYGCCAFPGDAEHRKEIYRLAGDGKGGGSTTRRGGWTACWWDGVPWQQRYPKPPES